MMGVKKLDWRQGYCKIFGQSRIFSRLLTLKKEVLSLQQRCQHVKQSGLLGLILRDLDILLDLLDLGVELLKLF